MGGWGDGGIGGWGTARQIVARVGAVVILVVLASAYWWMPVALRRLTFFGVRRVEVSGTRYLAPEVVVRALSLGAAANVFDDLGTMTRRLESLGGIARARVTRKLPSTLAVEVTEVEPVAMAAGPEGLIPLAPDARPLPYDVVRAPVDAPIVRDADPTLLESLSRVQTADLGLYGDVVAARANGSELVLDLAGGRMRLRMPVDPVVVRKLSLVRGDLAAHGREWSELDGRFGGWIVVRTGADSGIRAVMQSPSRQVARPAKRPAVRRVPRPRSPHAGRRIAHLATWRLGDLATWRLGDLIA